MRLVKVVSPAGTGTAVVKTAFSVGINTVSSHQAERHSTGADSRIVDVIDIETSTPKAKQFVESLVREEYFDPQTFSLNVRQPRSIFSKENVRDLTAPLAEPPIDLSEELWQFTRITYGLIGRVFIAGCLLAYGLIQHQILLMIAGVLFLPALPMLMAVALGVSSGQWKLAFQGLVAQFTATLLLVAAGAAIALLSDPPARYNEFNSLAVGALISLAVGVAAGLAAVDDTGRRELIGLAAAAQIGIIPVWLGVSAIFGLPPGTGESELYTHAASFFINILMLILGAAVVLFAVMGPRFDLLECRGRD